MEPDSKMANNQTMSNIYIMPLRHKSWRTEGAKPPSPDSNNKYNAHTRTKTNNALYADL